MRNFAVLTTVGHLAFACAEMRNCYLIEAVCSEFPDPFNCGIEEPWMREAFHFEYGIPFEDYKVCKHRRDGKCVKTCKHQCCRKESPLLPCVDITIEDREGKCVLFNFLLLLLFILYFFDSLLGFLFIDCGWKMLCTRRMLENSNPWKKTRIGTLHLAVDIMLLVVLASQP